MSRQKFLHTAPERFVAGTVGAPGERAFFLQVRSTHAIHTVAVEKVQVETLAIRMQEIIKDIRRSAVASEDEMALTLPVDDAPLEFPLDQEFSVGIIGMHWDSQTQRIILDLQAISDLGVEDLLTDDEALSLEDAPDLLSIHIRIATARNFAQRALALVNAGRPPCIFCGSPINPTGHLCPRANGYRR